MVRRVGVRGSREDTYICTLSTEETVSAVEAVCKGELVFNYKGFTTVKAAGWHDETSSHRENTSTNRLVYIGEACRVSTCVHVVASA